MRGTRVLAFFSPAIAAVLFTLGAYAQTPSPSPSAGGAERILSEHGAWQIRCRENSSRPCFMIQTAVDGDGNPIVEFSLVRFQSQDQTVVAGGSAIVPLGTALPEGLILQIDQGPSLVFAYDFCTRGGCVSNLALTQAQVDEMKRGSLASVTIIPALRPDQSITVPISLIGFTDAYNSLVPAEQ